MRQWLATQEVMRRLYHEGDMTALRLTSEVLEQIEQTLSTLSAVHHLSTSAPHDAPGSAA